MIVDRLRYLSPGVSLGGGWGFSAQFSGIITLSLEVYLGDQLSSKCTKKSFVSYSVNEI